jgi:hypothetical protein
MVRESCRQAALLKQSRTLAHQGLIGASKLLPAKGASMRLRDMGQLVQDGQQPPRPQRQVILPLSLVFQAPARLRRHLGSITTRCTVGKPVCDHSDARIRST